MNQQRARDPNYCLDDFPTLSPDQFYRRVKWLETAGLIETFRGKSNRIMLSSAAAGVLSRLLAVEAEHEAAGLAWSMERLRYEIAHERAAMLEDNLQYSRTEVAQLRQALVRVKRNPLSRIWRRLIRWGSGFRRVLGAGPEPPGTKTG